MFLEGFDAFRRGVGGGRVCGGWRVEKGDDEVFVMFCRVKESEGMSRLGEFEKLVVDMEAVVDVKLVQ